MTVEPEIAAAGSGRLHPVCAGGSTQDEASSEAVRYVDCTKPIRKLQAFFG